MPAAKGMAHAILKRTAHITVIVEGDVSTAAKKSKDKIATLTTGEYVAEEQKAAKKEEKEHAETHDHEGHDHEHLEKHDTEERDVETVADKKVQAFQKIKMNQMGADKKKTHRRKSIG
ncbi:MAG: hypothetical protein AAB649_04960, partial [Patescibacteria group bacterium]